MIKHGAISIVLLALGNLISSFNPHSHRCSFVFTLQLLNDMHDLQLRLIIIFSPYKAGWYITILVEIAVLKVLEIC